MSRGLPKTLLLLRPRGAAPSPVLAHDVKRRLTTALADMGHAIEELVLHATEEAPPRVSLVPFRRHALCMVGVRGSESAALHVRRALEPLGPVHGYLVEESSPRARPRSWPLGERAPGVAMITLFARHPRLDHETFLREWHGHHTPLALEIHPLVGYVRNTVEELLDAGGPAWDGVVVESFAEPADLLSPHRLFGGLARALPNMLRVGAHVSRFLELRTLENHLVREHVLRDGGAEG